MTDKKNTQLKPPQHENRLPCKTKAEVNFLVLPYFSLDRDDDRNRRIEFSEIQQRGNETYEIVWTVIPHPDFGLPRDFERRLQRAVEHSISNLPRPIFNPVPLPNYRELARIMGVTCSGRFVEKVRQGLIAMMMTGIMSKRSYYNKRKKAWLEEGFHLYDKIIFKGEQLSDDETADRNYAHFTSGYLDNLNAMYVRPIDYEYLKSLKPIASRLYELLGVKFYGHREYIQYKYSTLCKLLPVRRQKNLSRSRQQFETAHAELTKTGFLDRYEWMTIQGAKDDWYIRYAPGIRFFDEMRALEQAPPEACQPAQLLEAITGEPEEALGGNSDVFGKNPAPDPAWSLFARVVRKYHEFDLRDEDHEWFGQRVLNNSAWQSLNLMEEIQNWSDWLDIEHRKKVAGKVHKFPRSNFKGSFLNWLNHSNHRVENAINNASASTGQKTFGRKGWDLPSDYRIDIM